jgi:hypothetical protein
MIERSCGRARLQVPCTAALLYSYAKVSEMWNEVEFTDLTKKTNARKVALTFWHFVILANEKDIAVGLAGHARW